VSSDPTVPTGNATLLGDEAQQPAPSLDLHEGGRIGRFRVQHVLGRGGMGIVVAATDDDLDRTVAVKVVASFGAGGSSARSQSRLLREARALARISHPNVITVHEVGTVGEDVFLAMEYIDGGTLGEWVERDDRSWREIVRSWIAAGRGLAAAHAAGLVHRDFKPANVLVSRDERIVVTDFGIVGLDPGATTDNESQPDDSALTRPGALIGTPRYMAPEQHGTNDVDPRADQFAFCVSLWEAIYREHPFDADSTAAMVGAVIEGRIRPAPETIAAPSQLRRILERGLSREPSLRYPAIELLLVDLERLLGAGRRRRWSIGATLALGGVLALGYASGRRQEPTADEDCAEARGDWSDVWDKPTRAGVETAFVASDDPAVRLSWQPFESALDAYAADADDAHVEVCRSAREADVDPVVIAVRQHCLRRSRAAVAALTELLAAGNDAVLRMALESVAALPRVQRCSLPEVQLPELHVPEALARDVKTIDGVTAKALVYGQSGEYEAALQLLERYQDSVDALGHHPTEARFYSALGSVHLSVDAAKAERALQRAYVAASRVGDPDGTVHAARLLATIGRHPERAAFWADVAVAFSERAGLVPGMELASARAIAAQSAGDVEQAEHWFNEALRMCDTAAERSEAHGNLGAFYGQRGRSEEARHHMTLAERGAASYFGKRHPHTLRWQVNLVALDVIDGNLDDALAGAQVLLEAQKAVLPPDHHELAITHGIIATGLRADKRLTEAREHDEESLRIHLMTSGEQTMRTIRALESLTEDTIALGAHDDALSYSARMMAIADSLLADKPERRAQYAVTRASALGHAGDGAQAIALLDTELQVLSSAALGGTRAAALIRAELGHWRLEAGQVAAARTLLEQAETFTATSRLSRGPMAQLAEDLERLAAAD